MRRLKPLFLLIIFGVITACSGSNFDRSGILTQAADSLIIPAYEDFASASDSLHISLEAFTENPNEATLISAQEQWKKAILSWKRAEVYNFGPVEDRVLVTSIDRWPTSEGGIETAIEKYDGSDDYLIRIGSNRRGLPAIEYVLFHDEASVIINEFKDEKRKGYVLLLSSSLMENSELVLTDWEEGYRDEFVQATGNRPNSGITLLANEVGYLLEMIRMDKLEVPFGKQTMGTPRLQMLESEYAQISKELIRANLVSAQQTFNGGEGQGFDDYLDALGIEGANGTRLSEDINEEYKAAISVIDNMEGSLREAILNDKKQVEQLIGHIQQLYIYTEVDMISQLSILDTFSDNDGD